MKKLIFSILTIILALPLIGNPIDETTAKQLAQNFWKENNIIGVRGDKVFKKRMDDAKFVNVAPQCGYSEFFIFNNENGKGFVIIAADDCVTPILGYSYDNNFVAENLPPNLKGWLDGYAEQIRMAVEMRADATEEIRANWECLRQGVNLPIKTETAVSPLITTLWDQVYPYNKYCPYNNLTGDYTPAGCVATAMAQIMKYWEYPTHGYGSHSYNDWFYGQISANFGNTTYQWSSMPARIYSNSSLAQINAVAALIYHCGVSVEMEYGINGSGASILYNDYDGVHTYCAENALKNYFGYSSYLQGKKKNDYSETTWINYLKTELNNSRPILYGGQGSGGHAFVCDGYDYFDRFSFNWGWSGNANDGWFYINNLNPNNSNYSNYQQAVIGIRPISYSITASANPSAGGSVSGHGTYYLERNCTLHATANTGYTFVNWTENGSHVSSNPYYTFTVTRSRNLVANFQRNNYTITVTANPISGGTVTGGNNLPYGQTCTVKATAKTGFVFENWTENGSVVSSNANYSFSVSGNRNLVANFERPKFTISTFAIPSGCGTITGGGDYSPNTTCTLKATPIEHYTFINWAEQGNSVSTNSTYSFTVTKDRNLVANFQRNKYTITAYAIPSVGGSVQGEGTYGSLTWCTVKAKANEGYSFARWTENGVQVSTKTNYSFEVTKNRILIANFIKSNNDIEEISGSKIEIYPNPTNGEFLIKCENMKHIRIVSLYGQTVYNAKVDGDQIRLDLSGFAKGVYMMHIEADAGQAIRKIVVE